MQFEGAVPLDLADAVGLDVAGDDAGEGAAQVGRQLVRRDVVRWAAQLQAAGLLPDLQNFWLCDAVARGGRIAWRYVGEAALYALTCCAFFLGARLLKSLYASYS